MFFGFEVLPVVAATSVVLALSVVWYSPQVFGRVWARDSKVDVASLEFDSAGAWKRLGMAFVVNLLVMLFMANMVLLAQKADVSPVKVAASIFGITFLLSGLQALQEQRGFAGFCINASFIAVTIFTGVVILNYWPW